MVTGTPPLQRIAYSHRLYIRYRVEHVPIWLKIVCWHVILRVVLMQCLVM